MDQFSYGWRCAYGDGGVCAVQFAHAIFLLMKIVAGARTWDELRNGSHAWRCPFFGALARFGPLGSDLVPLREQVPERGPQL